MARWTGLAALAGSWVVLGACEVDPKDTDGEYTEAEFAQDLERRVCEMIEECGGPECAYPDRTATVSTATPDCDFDPEAAAACLDEPWECSSDSGYGSYVVIPFVCTDVCGVFDSTTGAL